MVRPDLPPPPAGVAPGEPTPEDLVRDSGLDPEAFDTAYADGTRASIRQIVERAGALEVAT